MSRTRLTRRNPPAQKSVLAFREKQVSLKGKRNWKLVPVGVSPELLAFPPRLINIHLRFRTKINRLLSAQSSKILVRPVSRQTIFKVFYLFYATSVTLCQRLATQSVQRAILDQKNKRQIRLEPQKIDSLI